MPAGFLMRRSSVPPDLTLDIPRTNLVSEYDVVNSAGMINDLAGGAHLTIQGSPPFLPGRGASFGAGHYATTPAVNLASNQAQTLVVVADVSTTSKRGVLYYSGDGGVAIGLGLNTMEVNGNNVICLYEGSVWKVGTAVGTGKMMLAVSVLGGTAKFYKNATLIDTSIGGSIGFSGATDSLASPVSARQLNGVDVFYALRYDTDLPQATIAEIYNEFVSYGIL